MDWVKFFTREEPVAGLEISADYLRLALLSQGKDKKSATAIIAEEPLKEGILSDGLVKNKEEFAAAVKGLLRKAKRRMRYVIISIPENKVFSKVFSFPESIRGERLKETMELTIGFQLPIKLADVYLDWEKVEDGSKNEVLLAAIQRTVVNNYISALEPTSLKIIAVEFHALSVARSISPSEKPVFIIIERQDGVTVGVIKNKLLRFMHVIPYSTLPKDRLATELRRIVNFYEGEYETLSKIMVLKKEGLDNIKKLNNLDIEEAAIVEPFSKSITTSPGEWLISAGAAMRGALPRADDALISLLPVGTEAAYEHQKAITFAKFAADVITVISIVFLSVFAGAWFMIISVQQSLNEQYGPFISSSMPQGIAELETRARHLNSVLGETNKIINTAPMWSSILAEIRILAGPNILITKVKSNVFTEKEVETPTGPNVLITNLSINSPEVALGIQGVAKDRDAINLFKKNFEGSPLFTDVSVPLTNLEKKTDIPFSMSFKLKDPQSVYLK